MKQPDESESLGKFEPSEAAMDQYRASRRRYARPALGFLAMMFLLLGLQKLHVPALVLLVLLGVGFIVWLVMVLQNGVVAVRADRRLKAEKREWDAKRARRTSRCHPTWSIEREAHEFHENVQDASMCVCGISAVTHAETQKRLLPRPATTT